MTAGTLRVWAPRARRVEIEIGHPATRRDQLEAVAGGWWRWPGDPSAAPDFDYAFVLDGDGPHPDPRSLWLPHGVNGATRWYDPSTFDWHDQRWRGPREGAGAVGGVFYELHVGTFTPEGTLDAAIGRLDHLVDLGVDVVELMPLAPFPGRWGWGYDGVAPYAVHEGYGGPAALQRFVDACHRAGLGVCLDVVYNHLGPSGNHVWAFGPYFTDDHHTPWGSGLNLDGADSAPVRQWVLDNAVQWLQDFHLDALRLDAVHALQDDSSRHLLAELADTVDALAVTLGRPLHLVAESDLNDPTMVTPTREGGLGMHAQWDDDIHHALHVTCTGETQGYYADFAGGTEALPEGGPLAVLATVLTEVFLHAGRMSTFRGRVWGAPVDRTTTGGRHFLAYLQTHDQVGNRATGDRIGLTCGPARQAAAAALYLLGPFTPMVFMGEEWGASTPFAYFTDFDDAELAEAVRNGRWREFAPHGWTQQTVPDPQDPATRGASVLRWEERSETGHAALLEVYRRLIRLRHDEPDLAGDRLDEVAVSYDEAQRWLTMRRGRILVVAGFGDLPAEVAVPVGASLVVAHEAGHDGDRVRLNGPGLAVLRLG